MDYEIDYKNSEYIWSTKKVFKNFTYASFLNTLYLALPDYIFRLSELIETS